MDVVILVYSATNLAKIGDLVKLILIFCRRLNQTQSPIPFLPYPNYWWFKRGNKWCDVTDRIPYLFTCRFSLFFGLFICFPSFFFLLYFSQVNLSIYLQGKPKIVKHIIGIQVNKIIFFYYRNTFLLYFWPTISNQSFHLI